MGSELILSFLKVQLSKVIRDDELEETMDLIEEALNAQAIEIFKQIEALPNLYKLTKEYKQLKTKWVKE